MIFLPLFYQRHRDPKAITTASTLRGTEECISLPGSACFALSRPGQSQLAVLQILAIVTEGGDQLGSVCELRDV